jgi:arylsulfatase A-like enzyme
VILKSVMNFCHLLALMAVFYAFVWNDLVDAQSHRNHQSKPNIIIFLVDDVGYGEFGFQGNSQVPTPNIDSIAKSGVRFTSGYSSSPYCSPARAGLLTGRYPTRFGHEFNEGDVGKTFGLPLTEKTLADRLKAEGYSTAAIGKWHLGYKSEFLPTKRGFDEYYGNLGNTSHFRPSGFIDSRIGEKSFQVEDKRFL